MSISTQLNEVSIRVSEASEILEILESSNCESVDDVRHLIEGIWEAHYAKENELLEIESELKKSRK